MVRKIKGRGPAPVHLWDPPFCGDMDMRIARDGTWVHEGKAIRRAALVELFASVLMLGDDGEYYLVTPVEKVRIQVEDCPFVAVDMDVEGEDVDQVLTFTTNIGEKIVAGIDNPLTIEVLPGGDEPHPILHVRAGLNALLSRAVFYRLVDLAQPKGPDSKDSQLGIFSGGQFFPLQDQSAG
ncbi:MAG: hypothetical protein DHS20C12_24060 [Pseudohongiella sp.]|nr:MAG: hypothetical protein DHS20C12_24060 [Pseudohongiella sp.]